MSDPTPAPESPTDEYERQVAERQDAIKDSLLGLVGFDARVHISLIAAAALAALGPEKDLWVIAAVLWFAAASLAVLSASVGFLNWRFLTPGLAAFGFPRGGRRRRTDRPCDLRSARNPAIRQTRRQRGRPAAFWTDAPRSGIEVSLPRPLSRGLAP